MVSYAKLKVAFAVAPDWEQKAQMIRTLINIHGGAQTCYERRAGDTHETITLIPIGNSNSFAEAILLGLPGATVQAHE